MALAVSKIARMNPAIFQRARSTLSTLTAPVLTRYVGVDSDGTRRLFDEVGATQGLRAGSKPLSVRTDQPWLGQCSAMSPERWLQRF
jgi:hypothetical protein